MSKKMLPIYIIKVLQEYSDEEHPLRINDIINWIENKYHETFERKAISRCIQELQELDYDINKNNGFYLQERTLNKNELHFLCDSIINSRVLSRKQAEHLFRKIVHTESNFFKRNYTHIHSVEQLSYSLNDEFFLNVELLNEAIKENKKIEMDYYSYGFDKKLHKRKEKPYIINPYDLIVANGKYYLIANYDEYDNISHYRIDKIKNIKILDKHVKNIKHIEDYKDGFSYPKHLMEHIYMFSGPSINVEIRFKNEILDQIIDWFGIDCDIEQGGEQSILRVKVNEIALKFWLKQYEEYAGRIK